MATSASGVTNPRFNSCVEVQLDCSEMWSLAQQHAYSRLTTFTDERKGQLLSFANVRARRIAATYARFYLETEDGGSPTKKGRYYWMALGAFASKTVACSMELKRVQALPTVYNGLARGNFWLFMDIAPWHWYWNKAPGSFWKCEPQRNAQTCVPQVRKVIDILPWAKEALPKINYLKTNPFIQKGFQFVAQIEAMTAAEKKRPAKQLEQLMAIAEHEQGKVLQPLIYEDKDFVFWVETQRYKSVSWASPALEISFTSACKTDDPTLVSTAPSATRLEDLQSRMFWIGKAAIQFHGLMQTRAAYMEGELRKMAEWVDMPDGSPPVFVTP